MTCRVDDRPDVTDNVIVVAVDRAERVTPPREDSQLVIIVGVGLQGIRVELGNVKWAPLWEPIFD